MAKTLELVFELAGKLQSSFTTATQAAAGQLTVVAKSMNKVSGAAQKRYEAKTLKDLSKAADDAGKAFGRLGNEVYKAFRDIAAPVAVGAGIYSIVTTSAGYADQAIKNAQSVGMSTAAFTEMAYAAEMAGVSQQDFVSGTAKLSKSVEAALGGNEQMIESFERAGISTADLFASLEQPEKLYAKLADTFASMPDGIGKTSLSMALLGKSGSKFIPFLNAGSAAMEQLREDARRLGISLSETDAKNAEAFNDSFANIGKAMRGVSLIIGKELWPHLTKVHESISKCISANGRLLAQNLPGWIEQFKQKLPEIESSIMAVCAGVRTTAVAINDMVQGMGGWIPLVEKLVYAWAAYRGLRIAKSMWDTGNAVADLGQKLFNLQRNGVSMRTLFSALNTGFKNLAENAKSARQIAEFSRSLEPIQKSGIAGVLSKISTWFISLAGSVKVFSLSLLASPIGLVVAGIAALGAAIYLCIKHWDDISSAIAWAGSALADFGKKVWSGIVKDFERLKEFFSGIWNAIGDGFNGLPGWVRDPLTKMGGYVADFGNAIWSSLVFIWDSVGASLSERFARISDAFENSFIGGLAETIKLFNPLSFIVEALNGIVKYITGFDIMSAGANLIARFGDGIMSAWDSIKGNIMSAVTGWLPDFITGGAPAKQAAAASPPMFAAGGVVTSPTLGMIGEAGPEVIIPVSRPTRARELMNTAADMMGLGGGGAGGNTEYHISFSPKITISGGGESVAEQVRQSMFQAKDEFLRMFKEAVFDDGRRAMR